MDLGFFIFLTIFVLITAIIFIARKGGFKTTEKIKELWKANGMDIRLLEQKFLGISKKKVIAIKREQKYLIVGMNWVVSSGRNQIPYWGIGIFTHSEVMKFSITRRRPTFLDGKRIKLNDPELDKMLVLKCKDEDWFRMYFNEGVLMEFAHTIPKNTIISYEKKSPVNINSILEEMAYDPYEPFIMVKRREIAAYSKVFNETIGVAEKLAKIFLHIR